MRKTKKTVEQLLRKKFLQSDLKIKSTASAKLLAACKLTIKMNYDILFLVWERSQRNIQK
jgi:hypothetical protein